MASGKPGILISSTCFDLRQVRANLVSFLEQDLGYTAFASEFPSFPVNPDVSTVENCRLRVEQHADVLILLIGTRYGFVESGERSITNLEYVTARGKGVPIFAFVEKHALSLAEAWKAGASMKHVVEDDRVFAFIDRVRSTDQVWTFPFETADDVVGALRAQLAFLQDEGLRVRLRMRASTGLADRYGLRGKAFRLAIEKPAAWEYSLFSQMLMDGVADLVEPRTAHRLAIALGGGDRLPSAEVPGWVSARLQEVERAVLSLTTLTGDSLDSAFGPPGTFGDEEQIIVLARQIIAVYRNLLDWAKRVRTVHTHERFDNLLQQLALLPDHALNAIEALGPSIAEQLAQALSSPRDEHRSIVIPFHLDVHNLEPVMEEMERLRRDSNWLKD